MTRELVAARAHFKTERGEPDAWVIDFAVLHPEGAVVEYHCEGLTADQVWAMVEDLSLIHICGRCSPGPGGRKRR